jgi:hypothetical protein
VQIGCSELSLLEALQRKKGNTLSRESIDVNLS